jgi:hypothetical protein
MLTETDAVVPLAPITSTGSVMVVGVDAEVVVGGGVVVVGVSVTMAVPVLVESTALVAMTVTV